MLFLVHICPRTDDPSKREKCGNKTPFWAKSPARGGLIPAYHCIFAQILFSNKGILGVPLCIKIPDFGSDKGKIPIFVFSYLNLAL